MEKNKRLISSIEKMKLTNKWKTNGILPNLWSEESSSLEEIDLDLPKKEVEKGSSKEITGKSDEKIEKQVDRKTATTSEEKHLDSKESSSFSEEHMIGNLGSREIIGKISGSRDFSKQISNSKEYTNESQKGDRKSEPKKSKYIISSRSLGSTEGIEDESTKFDKKKEHIVSEVIRKKKTPKREPRPYYYNDLLDEIPKSLRNTDDDSSERSYPYSRTIPPNLKENKLTMPIRQRIPRPFCYDELLDGVTESLINLEELKSDGVKVTAEKDFNLPLIQSPSQTQKLSGANRIAEDESKESEIESVQGMPTEMANKSNLLKSDSFVFNKNIAKNDALSAQKLVKGENVLDFTCNYIFSKKDLERAMKFEHKFLWKQQQHISNFCQSEAMNDGKNRSPNVVNFNEGAIHLLPTLTNDSRYIHASQINIPYGNFIIAQGPTKQSLIDFFRMLWQYHVLLVICLDPLTDPTTCYPYFSFKKQQIVKVRERISLETREIIDTPVANLFVYEAVLTNMEIRNGANKRCIHIMRYDEWTDEKAISPVLLIKMITVMETIIEKRRKPIVVHGSYGIRRSGIFVITSLLMRQISETHRMSVLNAAIAVRKYRYGVLRFLTDYHLVLQTVLCYAKECNLIRNEKAFMDAINILKGNDDYV
uniref:Tyrosine-protein phosphatase domain-containing protein n=1 Tax=Wuchereria bancrofti TaxID=6293 RepID=A0AAF5PRA2_WUCBA